MDRLLWSMTTIRLWAKSLEDDLAGNEQSGHNRKLPRDNKIYKNHQKGEPRFRPKHDVERYAIPHRVG